MEKIIDRKERLSTLLLTHADFKKSVAQVNRLTDYKGSRFDTVILPLKFKDIFPTSYLYSCLLGTMLYGGVIRSKFVYY